MGYVKYVNQWTRTGTVHMNIHKMCGCVGFSDELIFSTVDMVARAKRMLSSVVDVAGEEAMRVWGLLGSPT